MTEISKTNNPKKIATKSRTALIEKPLLLLSKTLKNSVVLHSIFQLKFSIKKHIFAQR